MEYMVDDTRLELVTSRTSSGCATSCANRPSAWIEYTRLPPLSSPFLHENEDSCTKTKILFIDPSTSASPARSHDRAGDGTSPPSAVSREIDRGRQTDCHTSDIGHWFAMTGGREQTSDARACGEAGNDSLRHPPRGRAADAPSLGEGGKGDGRIATPVTSVTGSQ